MTCCFLKIPSFLVGKLTLLKVWYTFSYSLIVCHLMYYWTLQCVYLWQIPVYSSSCANSLPFVLCSISEKEDQVGCQCTWDVVKGKIAKSLLAIENGVIVEENFVESESDRAKRPLSLYAVANGPRFRLLMSSIEQLEKEVGTEQVLYVRAAFFIMSLVSFLDILYDSRKWTLK